MEKLDFNLTEKEISFVKRHFELIGNGAETPEELIDNNYSYATPKEFVNETRNKFQVAGLISSLESKGVIVLDEGALDTEDCYYISYGFLEALPREESFENIVLQVL